MKSEEQVFTYSLPKVDLLETVQINDEKGSSVMDRANGILMDAEVTRVEHMIMLAVTQGGSKAAQRIGQVTAELTNKVKADWHSKVAACVARVADSMLQKGEDKKDKKEKKEKSKKNK